MAPPPRFHPGTAKYHFRASGKIVTPGISTPEQAPQRPWRMPVLPRINFFDSRRKGSIPYVPRQRLAPGVPRRLEAGRPGWGGVVGLLGSVGFLRVAPRLIGQRESGSRRSTSPSWWIMTLTTEIQANIDNMVAQATGEDDE